jgi:hypothetical protein
VPEIFISYSSNDEALALEIAKQLKEIRDVKPYITGRPDTIKHRWRKEILEALGRADAIIPLITPLSCNNVWVNFECGYFWGIKKDDSTIFPLRHPKSLLPPPLAEIQAKDITNKEALSARIQDICHHFDIVYPEQIMLDEIVQKALALKFLTPDDEQKQWDCRVKLQKAGTRDEKQEIITFMKRLDILHDAPLQGLDLQEVDFAPDPNIKVQYSGNMERIDLGGCDLRKVSFWGTNLEGAKLGSTDLRHAVFAKVSTVEGASFQHATIDETTTLPDGKKGYKPSEAFAKLVALGAVIDR